MRLLILLLCPTFVIAQKNYSGHVIDNLTGKAVPYATIGLMKENRGVSADINGVFVISSSLKQDTLLFSSVGYQPLEVPVSNWRQGAIAKLVKNEDLLTEVIVSRGSKPQPTTLNNFGNCSWNSYTTGLNALHQVAQRFYAPQPGMQLTELELCKDKAQSIFRLRIYDIDSIDNSPSLDLVDTVIEVASSEGHVRIDLRKYSIMIPNESFFVAIEWLFIPFNAERQIVKRKGKRVQSTFYKPAIKWVSYRNMPPGYIWHRRFNGTWYQVPNSIQEINFQITAKLR